MGTTLREILNDNGGRFVIHTKIEFDLGSNIDDCVKKLLMYKSNGGLAYGEFNGVPLYSDSVSLDSAYLLIMGMTKAELDKSVEEKRIKSEEKKQAHEDAIPELTKHWIEKGHKILSEDKWALWDECVPIRLRDIYNGAELGACLDIVEILNSGDSLANASKALNNQGHSGMSYNLVVSMVKSFADHGDAFSEFVM